MRAFALGVVATGLVAYTFATVVTIAVAAAGAALDVHVGPVSLLAVEQLADGGGSATTLGAGLVLVALLGGLANAVAALALRGRRGR